MPASSLRPTGLWSDAAVRPSSCRPHGTVLLPSASMPIPGPEKNTVRFCTVASFFVVMVPLGVYTDSVREAGRQPNHSSTLQFDTHRLVHNDGGANGLLKKVKF